jgi:hypothetical protein
MVYIICQYIIDNLKNNSLMMNTETVNFCAPINPSNEEMEISNNCSSAFDDPHFDEKSFKRKWRHNYLRRLSDEEFLIVMLNSKDTNYLPPITLAKPGDSDWTSALRSNTGTGIAWACLNRHLLLTMEVENFKANAGITADRTLESMLAELAEYRRLGILSDFN